MLSKVLPQMLPQLLPLTKMLPYLPQVSQNPTNMLMPYVLTKMLPYLPQVLTKK
jgi:hypothetical protein